MQKQKTHSKQNTKEKMTIHFKILYVPPANKTTAKSYKDKYMELKEKKEREKILKELEEIVKMKNKYE